MKVELRKKILNFIENIQTKSQMKLNHLTLNSDIKSEKIMKVLSVTNLPFRFHSHARNRKVSSMLEKDIMQRSNSLWRSAMWFVSRKKPQKKNMGKGFKGIWFFSWSEVKEQNDVIFDNFKGIWSNFWRILSNKLYTYQNVIVWSWHKYSMFTSLLKAVTRHEVICFTFVDYWVSRGPIWYLFIIWFIYNWYPS